MSWADEFDLSTNEERKMIICKLIKQIIIAIGTQDQRYINEDSDRYGIDFYSKKYPVEESVKMALETIEVFKTIIIGK